MATIYSWSGKQWHNAKIVGVGKDSFTGEKDVLIVQHPDLANNAPVDFYAQPDDEGKHCNVGNRAFWLELK